MMNVEGTLDTTDRRTQNHEETFYCNYRCITSCVSKPQEEILRKSNILKELTFELCGLIQCSKDIGNPIYTTKKLEQTSEVYKSISKQFTDSNEKCFHLQGISRIHNPYLLVQYNIKKEFYKKQKIQVKEKILFHGTTKCNLDSICTSNFNWRFCGSNVGHKYGFGVSFTPIAYFTTNYTDTDGIKVMIAAKVLVGKYHLGNEDTKIPRDTFDATVDREKNPEVYVKYGDNEFYPAYIIYYDGNDKRQDEKLEKRKEKAEERRITMRPTFTLADYWPK